jgi:hypothetical protein
MDTSVQGRAAVTPTATDARSVGDPLTIGAIAIVAYATASLLHEGGGHGTACALVGGKPQVFNAIFFACDEAELGSSLVKWVAAAGSIANLLVASLLWLPLRALRRRPGPAHFFVWLLVALNLLTPFGYLLFSGVAGIGDWQVVVDDLRPAALYRVLLAALGAGLYFVVTPRLIMPDLNLYLGRDPALRRSRAMRYALLPYLVGGVTDLVAGMLNPEGVALVLISAAAASLGGTSLLAWYPSSPRAHGIASAPATPASIPRSLLWIVVGASVLVVFVAVFGPGISVDPAFAGAETDGGSTDRDAATAPADAARSQADEPDVSESRAGPRRAAAASGAPHDRDVEGRPREAP